MNNRSQRRVKRAFCASCLEPLERRRLLASVSGIVFNDSNANKLRDGGEGGIQDATVFADLNNDMFHDFGEPATQTDFNGNYKLAGLNAGTYRIRVDLYFYGLNEWTFTLPSSQNTGISVTLSSATSSVSGKNFAARHASPEYSATISGVVFDDANGNGTRDSGENGLGNHRYLFIDADNDKVRDTSEEITYTDESGNYRFSDLKAGTYRVRQVLFKNWKQTSPSGSISVTVKARQNATGKNFGAKPISGSANRSIRGKVFHDWDDDRVLDTVETGQARVTVYADVDRDGSLDYMYEPWTLSDSTGNYRLGDLISGSYDVRATFSSAYFSSSYRNRFISPLRVSVTDGNSSGNNFAVTVTRRVTGAVWVDSDSNGIKDPGEAALAGWSVFVDFNKDGILNPGEVQTTTDTNGGYVLRFSPLGNFRVRVVPQPGYTSIGSVYQDNGPFGFTGNFRFMTA